MRSLLSILLILIGSINVAYSADNASDKASVDWHWKSLANQIDNNTLHIFATESVIIPVVITAQNAAELKLSWKSTILSSGLNAPLHPATPLIPASILKDIENVRKSPRGKTHTARKIQSKTDQALHRDSGIVIGGQYRDLSSLRTIFTLTFDGSALERKSRVLLEFSDEKLGKLGDLQLSVHKVSPLTQLKEPTKESPIVVFGESEELRKIFLKHGVTAISDGQRGYHRERFPLEIRLDAFSSSNRLQPIRHAHDFGQRNIVQIDNRVFLDSKAIVADYENPLFHYQLAECLLWGADVINKQFKGDTL